MAVHGIAGARESRELRECMTKSFTRTRLRIIGACFEMSTTRAAVGTGLSRMPGYEFEHADSGNRKPSLTYRGRVALRADYVASGKLSLKLSVDDEHRAQLLNYLNATGFELGL